MQRCGTETIAGSDVLSDWPILGNEGRFPKAFTKDEPEAQH
jgi:hypothetical protein